MNPEPKAKLIPITSKDGWRLVHEATGAAVAMHEEVKDFRGDRETITGGTPPAGPGKSGYVWTVNGAEFYPTVFGLKWLPPED